MARGARRSIICSMESSPQRALEADGLIIGGGPAGSALACLLARWGRRIVLLHTAERGGGLAEETLVPGASGVIERLGLTGALESSGELGLDRQGGIWESGELVWRELTEASRGRQVRRSALDATLRARAVEVGVHVIEVARIEGAVRNGEPVHALTQEGEAVRVEAAVVACATGRMTPSSLVDHEVEAELPATICVHAHAEDADKDRAGSVIEAVREGWLWWLPSTGGGANLALFADAEEVRERGREEVWQSALAGARGPAAGVSLESAGGTIATATLRRSRCDTLLVGDAAAALDPLSSQGIEKALTSAEDAAYAMNTLLEAPELSGAVRDQRHSWEREVFRAHARTTLETYALVERFRDGPFWSRRLKALESWGRARCVVAPDSRLTPSDEAREVTTLIRKGRRLVEARGWQLSEETHALQQLHGIEVGAVMELFDTPRTALASIEQAGTDARFYASSRAGLSLAIEELVARGFLVEAP